MFRLRTSALVAIALLAMFAACTNDGEEEAESSPDELYQVSTLAALSAGGYDGLTTFDELLEHGDFGLGTFDALDGELIVLDGTAYRVPADGIPVEVDGSTTTPFAAVTFWEPDEAYSYASPMSCADLQSAIDLRLRTDGRLGDPYAIRIWGEFTSMTTRSEARQEKPYAPLAEVLEEQIEFELRDLSATMVGFRLPDYMTSSNAAGYHFHAVDQALTVGGHVIDCETAGVVVELDSIESWQVDALSD